MALPKKTKSSNDDVSKTKIVKKETLKERIKKDQAKKIKSEPILCLILSATFSS